MSEMAEKWGRKVAERGFAQVPNYLLLINQFLEEEHRLSPVEMLILLQLVGSWWKKDEAPFPSLRTLAARAGISDRQAQRAVTALEEEGYLRREKRKRGRLVASNSYNLAPLVERLKEIAIAFPNDSPRKVQRKSGSPSTSLKIRRRATALASTE
jgi:hypothetical protein